MTSFRDCLRRFRLRATSPATPRDPIALGPADPRLVEEGHVVGVWPPSVPALAAEAAVRGTRQVAGRSWTRPLRLDWHYAGGRIRVVGEGDPKDLARARRLLDDLLAFTPHHQVGPSPDRIGAAGFGWAAEEDPS